MSDRRVSRQDLFEAFEAGFGASGEGNNAEHPYGDKGDWDGMNRYLRKRFEQWINEKGATSHDPH